MGDPKFSRRKYDTPSHPWRSDRIKNETDIQSRYGLKNKREVWKAKSLVRNFRVQSRDLQARLRTGEKQAEIEMKQLLDKCGRLGLLPSEGTTLNDVLAINVENILSRRFQTMVFQKGMAHSHDQARQFIVHGHIAIKGRIVTIPGYLVRRSEENEITFSDRSPLANDLHPMRPKPKDSIDIEKEKTLVEREKPKEKSDEKSKAPPKKDQHEPKHLKTAKPSLEKMLKKDGAVEKETAELPEPEDVIEEEKKPEAKKPNAHKTVVKKGEGKKPETKDKPKKEK